MERDGSVVSEDRLNILVVDDEVNIRRVLAVCLETRGHRITAVGGFRRPGGSRPPGLRPGFRRSPAGDRQRARPHPPPSHGVALAQDRRHHRVCLDRNGCGSHEAGRRGLHSQAVRPRAGPSGGGPGGGPAPDGAPPFVPAGRPPPRQSGDHFPVPPSRPWRRRSRRPARWLGPKRSFSFAVRAERENPSWPGPSTPGARAAPSRLGSFPVPPSARSFWKASFSATPRGLLPERSATTPAVSPPARAAPSSRRNRRSSPFDPARAASLFAGPGI